MPKKPDDKSAGDILRDVAHSLWPDDDAVTALARHLDVKTSVVKDWTSGRRRSFNLDHPVFDALGSLLKEREAALRRARGDLERRQKRWRAAKPTAA